MSRPSRLLTGLAGPVLACLLALTGCSSLQGTGDKGYVSGDGSVRVVAAADRGQPVQLTGEDLDGKPLDLTDLRGKPTVVVVWGAWCVDCRAEAPQLVAAAKRLGDRAGFVGIDVRDGSPEQAQSFVRHFGVPYRSFYSPDGRALLQFQGTLSPRTIPSTVVLDGDGRIAASIIGQIPSTTTLVDVVEDVAAGRTVRG
ncbi:TlpA family protein disulfide reductase [Nocardioides panaciterrulae]|uniref:Thiol-disulfide isomerase/thioredoxin n=1 Tax=Nocardioides panaciterrulae TaxID=661492 RepID=A0A7Y9E938_9ACTN|nr:TlpA disulfide reductase family protein [Nocardioides panaciterrulae]NYD43489.1 thiol-disulfide isomerase/thioredoxin [Nocardioides panaciterrulae]